MVATRSGRSSGGGKDAPAPAPAAKPKATAAGKATAAKATKAAPPSRSPPQSPPRSAARPAPKVVSPARPLSPVASRGGAGPSGMPSPRSETLVKSVGKSAKTPAPAAKTPAARTPGSASQQRVQSLSRVPLPDLEPSVTEAAYASEEEADVLGPLRGGRKAGKKAGGGLFGGLAKALVAALLLAGLLPALLGALCTQQAALAGRLPPDLAPRVGQACAAVDVVQDRIITASQQGSAWADARLQEGLALLPPDVAAQLRAGGAEALALARAAAGEAWQQAQALKQWLLTPTTGPGTKPVVTFQAVLSLPSLSALVDGSDPSQQHLQALWDSVPRQVTEKQKALGMLVSCTHMAECVTFGEGLLAAVQPESCQLLLHGSDFNGEGAPGELQAALTNFLRGSCAHGVVLVAEPELLSLKALAVLNNALSESGHLTLDGRAVASSRAAFVLLLELPPGRANAKEELRGALLRGGEDVYAVVRALLRRIDGVFAARAVPRQPEPVPEPEPEPEPAGAEGSEGLYEPSTYEAADNSAYYN